MNKICFQLLLTIAVVLSAGCGESTETGREMQVSISDIEPVVASADSTFLDLDGRGVELVNYAGKRVILNYWATWCAPCIEEIPSLGRAQEALGEDYVFLLASDESLEQISEFVADRGFAGNFIKLNAYFSSHGVQAVPSTILYDEQGNELQTWLGAYEWDSEAMLAEIRNL